MYFAGKKMKILISADIEGVSGVTHPDQINPGGTFYKETLNRWAAELNAIIDGLNECSVNEIVILDSHNNMRNLDNALVPKALVVSGWQRPYSMVSQIDKGYSACFFTGYHAMAGSRSTLSHTYRSKIFKQVSINKVIVGECGLNATLCGYFNVPVVFLSGDEEVCMEAQSLLGSQLVTVQTKRGLSRYSALSFPFEINLKNLKEGAIKAIKEKPKWKVFKTFKAPYTINVEFYESSHADGAELIPNVKRVSNTGVEFTDNDYSVVFKCFLAMGALAASRDVVT